MHNYPHMHDARACAIDLLTQVGNDPYKQTTLKLLIEILDELKRTTSASLVSRMDLLPGLSWSS